MAERQIKDPPRWFIPAVFAGMALSAAGIGGAVALLHEPPDGTVSIGERTYVIPPDAVSSLDRDSDLSIRVRPAGEAFEIVHDAVAKGRRDAAGVPHIFSVNDGGQHDVWYAKKERSIVVCRPAPGSADVCGTWISYGGATWSVLFPEARIRDADRFARRARALLERYDTRAIGVVR